MMDMSANEKAVSLNLHRYTTAVLAIDASHVKATHRRAAARVQLGKLEEALVDYAVVKRAFPRHKVGLHMLNAVDP
jgi:hypothetical protein